MSEATTVLHVLTREFGPSAGLAAALAQDRAAHSVGSFALSAGDVSRTWGFSRDTAKRALSDLVDRGFLERVGGVAGGKSHFTLGPAATHLTGCKMHPLSGGALKKDFKGWGKMHHPPAADLRAELLTWLLLDSDVDAVLAAYPLAWVWAKLTDCRNRKVAHGRRAQYLQAALRSWRDPDERSRVQRRLQAEATRRRRAVDRALAERQTARARELAALHANALEARALAWWRELPEPARLDLATAYRAQAGDWLEELAVFDPEANPWSAAFLVERWWGEQGSGVRGQEGRPALGVDLQRDGRRYGVGLRAQGSGFRLEAWVCATGWDELPVWEGLSPAATSDLTPEPCPLPTVLVDEGDGATTAAAREWVALARANGLLAHTWKGGDRVQGADVQPVADVLNARHFNERHWAAAALALLADPGRLLVPPSALSDDALWHGLAGRLSLDESTPDDHYFDALKLAVAASQLNTENTEATEGRESK